MKIAIIGYGKMGRTIEKIATKEKIEVVCIIDKEMQKGDLSKADVSINFCVPSAAVENIFKSFARINFVKIQKLKQLLKLKKNNLKMSLLNIRRCHQLGIQ